MTVPKWADMVENIVACESLQGLEALLHQMRHDLGASHLIYHWINAGGELIGAGTYDEAWRKHYLDNNYQRSDPVVRAGLGASSPVVWSRLDWSSKSARALMDDATAAGVGRDGLTVPLHGPRGQFAHVTLTHEQSGPQFEALAGKLSQSLLILGHAINTKVMELRRKEEPAQIMPLSPRETDALSYLAAGLNRDNAAERMNISPHTLRVYIESARQKLNAQNTVHAVTLAVHHGFVVL